MQNQIDQCPYINLKSKADLEFDYQTNNLKLENKNNPNTIIHYLDKNDNSYSNFSLIKKFLDAKNSRILLKFLKKAFLPQNCIKLEYSKDSFLRRKEGIKLKNLTLILRK